MSVELSNPDGLYKPNAYSQVAVGTGSRLVYLSGQVALDEQGNIVGKGDLAAQAEQAYLNVVAALAGVGATMNDVVKVTVYVPDWRPDKMQLLIDGAMRAAQKRGFDPRRTMTLVGVASLSSPDLLIEVEAVAVLD